MRILTVNLLIIFLNFIAQQYFLNRTFIINYSTYKLPHGLFMSMLYMLDMRKFIKFTLNIILMIIIMIWYDNNDVKFKIIAYAYVI